jgi:SAM-dependent methyltransferase
MIHVGRLYSAATMGILRMPVRTEPQHDPSPRRPVAGPSCRFCAQPLTHTFVDLGATPLCQRHITPQQYHEPELIWPLHAWVCDRCFLVQLSHEVKPQVLFSDDYAYFSSYSESWLRHAEAYVERMTTRLGLGPASKVIEIASNDEPTANTAAVAREKGIPTCGEFFGMPLANKLAAEQQADLIVGNNVLAHVPELNDFVAGLKMLLKPGGTITMEFPHLIRLMAENQFDTIYHEHFSYFSFFTVEKIFAEHGLTLFDVEELPTHGGSLRIYARHITESHRSVSAAVRELRQREMQLGVTDLSFYASFTEQVKETKRKLLEFLIQAKREGKSIVGYGAPGKGNTLLNYCGIRTDFIDYTVDRSPHKQGNFLPGSRIPIEAPRRISETRPDYVLILPWNLQPEIVEQMSHIRQWGGRFVVPIPQVRVL